VLLDQDALVDAQLQLPGLLLNDISVLGPTTARLTGFVDPGTLATRVFLQYGTNGVLDTATPAIDLNGGTDVSRMVADLLDLEPGTEYVARLVAETAEGTVATSVKRFTTPGATVVSVESGGTVSGSGKQARCTIVGTEGSDVLVGSSKRDVICGLGGADRIRGRGGRDTIVGGYGKDRIKGGRGNDRIWGNGGNDRVRGKSGNDRLSGGRGSDRIRGDSGRDRLFGNSGNDRLAGNGGRDRLAGSSGRDRIAAARDHNRGDRVSGGRGRDYAKVGQRDRVSSVERLRRR
jgi:Ca2+-binding RTX toxin-like protein